VPAPSFLWGLVCLVRGDAISFCEE
jgi:hypothetical protein